MKITKITKAQPKEATLPDGTYIGVWGGYNIELLYQKTKYDLTTEEGIRGFGSKVVVTIKDGIATFVEVSSQNY